MIIPDFRVLVIDETEHWREDIVEKAGKLLSIYVVDINLFVYVAEFTASYECHFLGTEPLNYLEDEHEREQLYQDIQEGNIDSDMVVYIHTGQVKEDRFTDKYELTEEEWLEWLDDHDGDRKAAHRALEEEVLEYYRGNAPSLD